MAIATLIEAQRDSLTESIADSLATKADLKASLAEHKLDVIKWMVGLSVAQLSLLAGILIKLL